MFNNVNTLLMNTPISNLLFSLTAAASLNLAGCKEDKPMDPAAFDKDVCTPTSEMEKAAWDTNRATHAVGRHLRYDAKTIPGDKGYYLASDLAKCCDGKNPEETGKCLSDQSDFTHNLNIPRHGSPFTPYCEENLARQIIAEQESITSTLNRCLQNYGTTTSE